MIWNGFDRSDHMTYVRVHLNTTLQYPLDKEYDVITLIKVVDPYFETLPWFMILIDNHKVS